MHEQRCCVLVRRRRSERRRVRAARASCGLLRILRLAERRVVRLRAFCVQRRVSDAVPLRDRSEWSGRALCRRDLLPACFGRLLLQGQHRRDRSGLRYRRRAVRVLQSRDEPMPGGQEEGGSLHGRLSEERSRYGSPIAQNQVRIAAV